MPDPSPAVPELDDLLLHEVGVAPADASSRDLLGAAAQAAAVLHGSTVDEVVEQWGRPPSTMALPGERSDNGAGTSAGNGADAAAMVRDAYARLRDRS